MMKIWKCKNVSTPFKNIPTHGDALHQAPPSNWIKIRLNFSINDNLTKFSHNLFNLTLI